MKEKLKFIKWGMKNHPGNFLYIVFISMGAIAGLKNQSIIWWKGLLFGLGIMILIFLPIYIWSSYSIGKSNLKK